MADVMSMDEIRGRFSSLGIDPDDIDWDSVLLTPGEDMCDDDYHLDEFDDSGFDNVVVIVDGLPVVSSDKFEELEGVIRRTFGKFGVVKESWMPVEEQTGKSKGFCFIHYNSPQEALLVKEKTDGRKFDKNHTLAVNTLEDVTEKLMKLFPEELVLPEKKPYIPSENLQKWLTDKGGRDQFLICAGTDTEVFWNDARLRKADPVYKRSHWTENFVKWSPLGTYLATVHRQGVVVWGGATSFNRLMRFPHPQVKLIDFSPGETYLVSYGTYDPSNPHDSNRQVLKIFEVRTGKLMRDFQGSADEFPNFWPVFRWGGGKEDKYFAVMGKNVIYVYETETFSLIGKKSIKLDNVMDFSWSPTDHLFAVYYVPELGGGNQPTRVSLYQIPSKEELRSKNLFSVSYCKLFWQSNGEYLAVQVERYTKSKKSMYTAFELFRIKERDIPIDVFELEDKNDKIIAFEWEPKGDRFAVIHGDNPRPDVSFYSVKGGKVSKLTTLRQKQVNALFWSPRGSFIVLAGLKGFNGKLEFFNVDGLKTMATAEHFMAMDIEWDPSGRYVATSVTSMHDMENGFNVWSFIGELVYHVQKDNFFQFLWRPRPPSLLSPEKEEEIEKNVKKHTEKYDLQDGDISCFLSAQENERRKLLKSEWESWVSKWKQNHEEEKMERQILRDGEGSEGEEEFEAKEIEVEELVDVSEESSLNF